MFVVCCVKLQSLGMSREQREAGYALMCIGFPRSDLVLEVVEEDEPVINVAHLKY